MLKKLFSFASTKKNQTISIRTLIIGGTILGIVSVLNVGATSAIYETGIAAKIKNKISSKLHKPETRPDTIELLTHHIETGLETIEFTEIPFGKIESVGSGGGIAEFENGILFSTPLGKFGFVDLEQQNLQYLDEQIEMNFEALKNSKPWNAVEFNRSWFRVSDILITKSDTTKWLYVTHHVFKGEDTFCNQISRIRLTSNNGIPEFEGDWENVYEVKPCRVVSEEDYGFAGHMTGGRMYKETDNSLLFTVGDWGMGQFEPENYPDGHREDWSSLLRINVDTNTAEIVSTGFRNAQGLNVDEYGRIWSTEHGPQGGDEINLVKPGVDYGWPHVSTGMHYADNYSPRNDITMSTLQGHHDGYEKPVLSFMPSIGISQILPIASDNAVFELWRGDLLVASMRAESLYRIRLDNERAVTSEKIHIGKRMRDLIALRDGHLVTLTDDNSIIIFSDPETHTPLASKMSGYTAINAMEAKVYASSGDEWRRDMFRWRCGSCHRVDGKTNVGPALNGVVGRKIGHLEGYPFSPELAESNDKWTEERLFKFVNSPAAAGFEDSAMPAIKATEHEIKGIIDYLKTTSN